MKTKLKRRDFGEMFKGGWVDPDFLPPGLKLRLRDHLPPKWDDQKRAIFLRRIGKAVQTNACMSTTVPAALLIEKLEQLSNRARSLLQTLNQLDAEVIAVLGAHAQYLVHGSNPPERLVYGMPSRGEEGLFVFWWDVIQDIETASEYMANQINPAKTARPAQDNARRLARFAAQAVISVTGKAPPVSKGSWFPAFMRVLGEHYGLTCGAALVSAAVRDLKTIN